MANNRGTKNRTMKREIAQLFAEVERLNEKVHEMLAERDDAMHKMFNGEISEKELKAMNKACTEASKGWKQAANIALKARSQARRQAAQKWRFKPDDQFIVMGDMRGRISSHRTVDDAIKAAKRDRETCKHQGAGAYSDVLVPLAFVAAGLGVALVSEPIRKFPARHVVFRDLVAPRPVKIPLGAVWKKTGSIPRSSLSS